MKKSTIFVICCRENDSRRSPEREIEKSLTCESGLKKTIFEEEMTMGLGHALDFLIQQRSTKRGGLLTEYIDGRKIAHGLTDLGLHKNYWTPTWTVKDTGEAAKEEALYHLLCTESTDYDTVSAAFVSCALFAESWECLADLAGYNPGSRQDLVHLDKPDYQLGRTLGFFEGMKALYSLPTYGEKIQPDITYKESGLWLAPLIIKQAPAIGDDELKQISGRIAPALASLIQGPVGGRRPRHRELVGHMILGVAHNCPGTMSNTGAMIINELTAKYFLSFENPNTRLEVLRKYLKDQR